MIYHVLLSLFIVKIILTGVTAGKLVLSPTRTYAPIIKKVLDDLFDELMLQVAEEEISYAVNKGCIL